METLNDKTILIGREEGKSRLMIVVNDGTLKRSTYMGQPGAVPNTVSRCKPTEDIAHCGIAIGHDGTLTINNLNVRNVTYVEGIAIDKKRISANNRVELGSQKYAINVGDILKTAEKMLAGPVSRQQEYDISRLEKVWNDYHDGLKAIQDEQYNVNMMSRVPMVFTFGAGMVTALANSFEWPKPVLYFTAVLTVIGFLMLIYGLWRSMKFHNGTEARERLTNNFKRDYTCPNCGNFLGSNDFFIIKKKNDCPYCHCKWKK